MPYLAEFSTYKPTVKTYWEAQIDASYGGDAGMKTQLNNFLDSVSTAETTYKTNNNNLSSDYLRYRWQQYFGFFNLYVLYAHCMTFPAEVPAVQGMMIPIVSGGTLIVDDDLRGFSVGWRYTWPGNGTTTDPWFSLSPGTVTSSGEVENMVTAFNSHYPFTLSRYSNTSVYAIGNDNGAGVFSNVSDNSPACMDRDRFYNDDQRYGTVGRLREFINYYGWTTQNYTRFRTGRTILNHLAAGGAVTVTDKPKDWMLAHGGTELMAYFGWTDIAGNIL
jgi:hypothetical protein